METKKRLLAILENSRNYTLAVAEAMPKNHYYNSPVDGIWNFGELMDHIAYGIEWWKDYYIIKVENQWNPPANKESKMETTVYLEQAYKLLKETVENTDPDDTVVDGFRSTLDHIAHHRGQATTYLRLARITPPEYNY
ncbi:MAG: hypothetical protein Mars2KO_31760 [Maribacter sp.]